MRILKSKRGISEWISFVLLIGFIVVISAFMADWMTGFAKSSSQNIQQRTYDTSICESIAISEDACSFSSQPQTLYINITNRQDLNIDALIFRLYQGADFEIQEMNLTNPIKPTKPWEKSRTLQVNASNITNVDTVEAIPEHFKDNYIVVCTKKVATATVLNCT